MRVIVCGSRGWTDRGRIADRLARVDLALPRGAEPPVIVHGAARGADRLAGEEALKLGLLVEAHPPDYETFSSKRAPHIRNEKMAKLGADLCIAFWDGRSRGTLDMINLAVTYNITVDVVMK